MATKKTATSASIHPPTDPTSDPHLYMDAFTKTAADRAALSADGLLPINLDVQTVIPTVLGIAPRVAGYRAEIVAALPKFDIATFDALVARAEALAHAQTLFLSASQPAEALPEVMAEALPLREQLLSDATALSKRGFLDGRRLADLKGGPGYLNIGSDLSVLAQMLRERWADIAGKCAVQASELDAAERLYQRINVAYGERSAQPAVVSKATEERQRAYTLLVEAYDEVRRALVYLRWHEGDVEKIAPSLYAGRRRSTGADDNATGTTGTTPPVGGTGAPAPTAPIAHEPHGDGAALPAAGTNAGPGGAPFAN
jgi:hypothetical protein